MQFSAHFVLDAEAYKHSEALQYKGVRLSWTGAHPAVRDPTTVTRRGRADLVRSCPATLSSPLARGQHVGPCLTAVCTRVKVRGAPVAAGSGAPTLGSQLFPLTLQRLGPLDPSNRLLPSSFEKISGKGAPHAFFPDCVGTSRSRRTKGVRIGAYCTTSESTTRLSVKASAAGASVSWLCERGMMVNYVSRHLVQRLGRLNNDLWSASSRFWEQRQC